MPGWSNNFRPEINTRREASQCSDDPYDPGRSYTVNGRAGRARYRHSQKSDIAGDKGSENLPQGEKTDRVHRARRNSERVEQPVTDFDVVELAINSSERCY